ncbi:unnamed protein product [Owenia fusiformis]|uniref:EGF-like domain-containing protein n=1 Tax=Owenia fusiformis TaxID=6347 RepID=A0A8S4NT10_OWEFU|nr:unnamed protein product [Owenia fusiformis]
MDKISYQGLYYIAFFIIREIGCSLVAFWPMNHEHIEEDISGHGNHLNISNVDLECGPMKRQAGALSFHGNVDSYARLAPSSSLDVQRSMTWMAYVYGGMPPNNQGPLLNFEYPCTGTGCKTWGTHIWRMGNILFFKVVMRNGTFTNAVSVSVLAPNEWRFVAVTYNYTSGDASIWNDGNKAQTRNVGSTEQATQYEAGMGIKLTEDSRAFSGRLACVQIHDEALDMSTFNRTQLENDCFGISDCSSDPCVFGTCHDECFGYMCACHPGYTGVHCEEDIDECESTQCYNNGTCVDLIANFTCDCVGYFGGRFCENETDPTTMADTTTEDITTTELDLTTTNADSNTEVSVFYSVETTPFYISTEMDSSITSLFSTITTSQAPSTGTTAATTATQLPTTDPLLAVPSSTAPVPTPLSPMDATTDSYDVVTVTTNVNTQDTKQMTVVTFKTVPDENKYVRAKRINYAVTEAVGSETIGTVMIVFVIAFIAFIVFLDSGILFRDTKKCFRNIFSTRRPKRQRAMYDFFTSMHPHLSDPTSNNINNTDDIPITAEPTEYANNKMDIRINDDDGDEPDDVGESDKINEAEIITLPNELTIKS